jgi:flagellar biosynthesis protein FlhG
MILGQAERIAELNNLRFAKNIKSVPIIAFTSGKGGTGKSTLALNLANLLAKQNKKVLLIDFDINFANLHVMLNVFPENTLNDYFTNKIELDELFHKHNENLSFIFGETGVVTSVKLTKAKLNEFFYAIKSSDKFDVIILDTASGGSPETLDILSFASLPVVVANPEPTAVMDAYAIIKLMVVHDIPSSSIQVLLLHSSLP